MSNKERNVDNASPSQKKVAVSPHRKARTGLIILILLMSVSGRIQVQPVDTSVSPPYLRMLDRIELRDLEPRSTMALVAVVIVLGLGLEGPVLRALSKKYLGVELDMEPTVKLPSSSRDDSSNP